MNQKFDFIMWYKPLDEVCKFDSSIKIPYPCCIRYNEMWDVEWTKQEIEESTENVGKIEDKQKSNIIICHHKNDWEKYKEIYKNDNTKMFYYNPHHANPEIFKPLVADVDGKEIDILLSGVSKPKHYPLKYRLFNLILKNKDTKLKKYNIFHHRHPGYNNKVNFTNVNQIEYNKLINKSKICIACTSKYNYRLGKYVEIAMAGSLICGDLPYEDESFKQFVIEANMKMSDEEILNNIVYYLENKEEYIKRRKVGLEWSKEYTTEKYVDKMIDIFTESTKVIQERKHKIFIISDEIRSNHPEFKNEKWICDILKEEFMMKFPDETTINPREADIIWYLAPWNKRFIPPKFSVEGWYNLLQEKQVVFTQHHIDKLKIETGEYTKQFEFMKRYGNRFHSICKLTSDELKNYFDPSKIYTQHLWINDEIFYAMEKSERKKLREIYNFSENAFLIGSFQKDTEGNSKQDPKPKLSKGPDIFVKVVGNMHKMYKLANNGKSIEVVLTGLRREYVMRELDKLGIKYHYFNMISLEEINELYNCLDLYVVSSRYEGGPRSVVEAGLTKTPIISTHVGIAEEFMPRESLFNVDNWLTYKNARPNTEILYQNIIRLTKEDHIIDFKNKLVM